MKKKHSPSVLVAQYDTKEVRYCKDCTLQPYQVWVKDKAGRNHILSFHVSKEEAVTVGMRGYYDRPQYLPVIQNRPLSLVS